MSFYFSWLIIPKLPCPIVVYHWGNVLRSFFSSVSHHYQGIKCEYVSEFQSRNSQFLNMQRLEFLQQILPWLETKNSWRIQGPLDTTPKMAMVSSKFKDWLIHINSNLIQMIHRCYYHKHILIYCEKIFGLWDCQKSHASAASFPFLSGVGVWHGGPDRCFFGWSKGKSNHAILGYHELSIYVYVSIHICILVWLYLSHKQ